MRPRNQIQDMHDSTGSSLMWRIVNYTKTRRPFSLSSMDFTDLCIKSDAQTLIRAINSQEQIKEVYGLLFDINSLASLCNSITFTFVPRESNRVADCIAKKSLTSCFPGLLLAPAPV
ncbi:unnamed protein product [Thlaspi arvense]|uniref:RNase H type-1 domain-containing protein n=1 Tax=Thlaspi arvense TaxID=13288 RepID=A0AAU9RBP0_THLAR|nr:unnamed protein product [Thlaspi arvense]